jgi:hypothetical protein
MLRAIGKVWLWTVPLVLAGCDDGGYYDDRYGGGYYGYCEQFSTCDECTPIIGCGWCTYGSGQGICLSEPSACRAQQFSWTWEQKGCGVKPDAGTVSDAGADTSSGEGGTAECRWPDTADTFIGSDAGASGCLPSTGGDLCSSSQYTLACYGTSTPDATLNCTASPVTGPQGVAFSCCPCAP